MTLPETICAKCGEPHEGAGRLCSLCAASVAGFEGTPFYREPEPDDDE